MPYEKAPEPKELTLDDYLSIGKFAPDDFKEQWRLKAAIIREIVWSLLCAYTDTHCEMTHSEFIENKESRYPDRLVFCATILETADITKNFHGFADYIKENLRVLPNNLRSEFKILIGFNYGDQGGVLIDQQGAMFVEQDIVESPVWEGYDRIGRGDRKEANDKLDAVGIEVDRILKESNPAQ